MIRTGRVVNLVLGVGDPSKFNLLGGSFGEAGDSSALGGGYGARFFPSMRAAVLRGVGTRGVGGGGGGGGTGGPAPVRPGEDGDWRDRTSRER